MSEHVTNLRVLSIRGAIIDDIEVAVYVGRSFPTNAYTLKGSPLANPFKTYQHDRESHQRVVNQYRLYLAQKTTEGDPEICAELNRLVDSYRTNGKLDLLCWCTPLPCHADVIREFIESAFLTGYRF